MEREQEEVSGFTEHPERPLKEARRMQRCRTLMLPEAAGHKRNLQKTDWEKGRLLPATSGRRDVWIQTALLKPAPRPRR